MSNNTHSDVGASSAHRWIPCSGCIRQAKDIPDTGSSFFAAEGTGAHALVEKCLILDMDAEEFKGELIHTEGEWEFYVDDDMIAAVQRMLDHVHSILEWCRTNVVKDPIIRVEFNVDLSWLRPGMFGTADVVIIAGGYLWVIDYKHGRGYSVDVIENPQLMYYGTGPAKFFDAVKDITLCIVQPRSDHPQGRIRSWSIKRNELLAWAENTLGPAVDATRGKNPKLCAGDHCRFCKALATCPESKKHAQESAGLDFDEVADLKGEGWEPDSVVTTDEAKLVRIMDAKGYVISYLNAVEKEVVRRLCAGEKFPGWKRVHGRANRRWKKAKSVVTFCRSMGFKYGEIHGEAKLLGPSPIEKLVKAEFKDKEERKQNLAILKGLWETPQGAPSLVREDDPREAIDPKARLAVPENEFDDLSADIFE